MKTSMITKAVALAALACAGSAQATDIIDFDGGQLSAYAHTNFSIFPFNFTNVYHMTTYLEDGYQLKSSAPLNLGSLYSPDAANAAYAGSPAMAATPFATSTLTKVGGAAFNLQSIDLIELARNRLARPDTVVFTGLKADNVTTVTASFTFGSTWQTFNFAGAFDNVVSVKWQESILLNHDYQYDNITIAAVPESGTYAMLAGGLGLLAFMNRRKKAA